MSIRGHVQGSDLGKPVTLWHIDMSMFNVADLYLCAGPIDGGAVVFGGQTYSPHPIEGDGFELKANGTIPQPKLTIGNIGGIITALVEAHDDMQGAIVTRTRTYRRFLDDGAEPDTTAVKPLDVYEISRKMDDTEDQIVFQLKALMDQEGKTLPGRVITKDYCSHTYRRWNGSSFDYSEATCPYAGASSFDINDDSASDANDVCGKRLSSCRARFGANAALPTRAFPGVSRLRAR